MKPYPSLSLGILGGGQLARLLALKAHDLGVRTRVLSASASDPAAQVARLWSQGALDDPKVLEEFLRSCDVVTFESEFLDAKLLRRLQLKTGTAIYPRPSHMAAIQDRLTQKNLLLRHRVPTAAYLPVSNFRQARAAWDAFGPAGGLVLKKRRFGYDGNGTFPVRTREELEALRLEVESNKTGFIAERLVRFRREAACMVVRGRTGKAVAMPLVETRQESARCLWVKGPLRIPAGAAFVKRLLRFADAIGYVGALGVELFDSPDGLIVNELAPRVHNSGHYTLEALAEDQFTAHVRAVLGLAVSKPRALADGYAMLNLLGEGVDPRWKAPVDVSLHWYGKTESRPGRKMGHLTALAQTSNAALKRLLSARLSFQV